MDLRNLVRALLVSCTLAATATSGLAQQFPAKPIKIQVGFGPGAGVDTLARLYASKLQEELKTPVIVENRPGAFQLLAIRPVLAAAPDGYTLFMGAASSLVTGPAIRSDLGYDPVTDFSHIAMIAKSQGVFSATPNFPGKTLDDLIAYAKSHPGQVNFGSAGVGASNHIQMEYLMNVSGTSMVHVPFRSDPDVVKEVSTGTVHVGLTIAQAGVGLINDGRLKPLAVTGTQRVKFLPNVPSLAESSNPKLREIDTYSFAALVGPRNMPDAVVQRLNAAINRISRMPDVITQVRDNMFNDEPLTWSPEEFRKYLQAEQLKWREAGKNIKLN